MTHDCGIYKITNIVNGDFYVGSSVNLRSRFSQHQSDLNGNCHVNAYLQNAWNKYGKDCFVFSLCERCGKERLIEREQYYIDSEKPIYNICKIAGNCLGVKHSEETKRKLRESWKTRPPMSEEHKRKISESTLGKRPTAEARAKMSEARKGKYPSEETKLKMSVSMKGKRRTDEFKRKVSEIHTGTRLSAETCAKLREVHTGMHPSEETRRKMSETKKRWWAEKRLQ